LLDGQQSKSSAAEVKQTTIGIDTISVKGLQVEAIARHAFGKRYAGVWIDSIEGQIKIGVADLHPRDSMVGLDLLEKLEASGTVVGVQYSQQQLQQVSATISKQLPRANRGAKVPIDIGERTDLNNIEITLPPSNLITPAQQKLSSDVSNRYSRLVRIYISRAAPATLPCRGVFCDPPLRSGIEAYTDLTGCTAGFIVRSRSDGKLYQLVAGHCRGRVNYNWLTEFTNATVHSIGPVHNYQYSRAGDVGIIAVRNPAGWKPRAWITVRGGSGQSANSSYHIHADRDAIVGQRVCVSGVAGYYTQCGLVSQTNVSVTYLHPQVTVSGLFQIELCSHPGDSGAPVFGANTAYGTVSGGTIAGSGARCITFAQPIVEAENLMRVNVSHEAS
jgi:hypothetical protein